MTELSRALPRPIYSGHEEELPAHAQTRGPRVVAASSLGSQVTLRKTGPPPYGSRTSWRPRNQEDFADGGAFPECNVAQYPLDMGKTKGSSNALVLKTGSTVQDTIAKQGHDSSRIVHTSFKDLIPLRQRADAGEVDLARPSEEQIAESKRKTEQALQMLVSTASAASKPKTIKTIRDQPTYVRYTPSANQMGDHKERPERIIKIVSRMIDPMEPPK